MKTETRFYHEGGEYYNITAKYGFDVDFAKRNNQEPYFSITADIKRQAKNGRWVEDSCGCLHDEISKHVKKLAPLIKWHMVHLSGMPTHYTANAIYWAQKVHGISIYKSQSYDPDPMKAFKSTVVFGAVETDNEQDILAMESITAQVTEWCEARREALNKAFLADMERFGCMPDQAEIVA